MRNARTTRAIFFEDAVEATFTTMEAMDAGIQQMPFGFEPAPGYGPLDVTFSYARAEWEPTVLAEVAAALTGAPEEAFYDLLDRSGTVAGFTSRIDGFEAAGA